MFTQIILINKDTNYNIAPRVENIEKKKKNGKCGYRKSKSFIIIKRGRQCKAGRE